MTQKFCLIKLAPTGWSGVGSHLVQRLTSPLPNNIAPSSILISIPSPVILHIPLILNYLDYSPSSVSQRSRYNKWRGTFLSLRQPKSLLKILTEFGLTTVGFHVKIKAFISSHGKRRRRARWTRGISSESSISPGQAHKNDIFQGLLSFHIQPANG